MRVCVLTSNQPRHRYLVNALAERFEIAAVFTQEKSPKRQPASRSKLLNLEGKEEIAQYVEDLRETERRYLLPYGESFRLPKEVPVYPVRADRLNDKAFVEKIKSLEVKVFVVFGTGLVKSEIMSLAPHFVNLHLGLSPYYRGHAGSFWPFYNDEPQYVGSTVFFLDEGIDSGPIIHQCLVDIEPGDTIHDASVKAIKGGIDLQVQAVCEIANGGVTSEPQDLTVGRNYYAKEFNVKVMRETLARWDDGRVKEYIGMQDRLKSSIRFVG